MNANDIFALISQDLARGDLAASKEKFFANRTTLYEANPLLTMKTNFELRFIAEEFEEAYQDNEFFQALPYVSQEVEEYLRELPRLIRANELASFQKKPRDEEANLKLLVPSTKSEELLLVVTSLGEGDITPYVPALANLLFAPEVHDDVKSFTLMLLSAKGIDETITLRKRGECFKVNPAKIGQPFGNADYDAMKQRLTKEKDTSLGEIGQQLLDQFALTLYPRRPLLEEGLEATYQGIKELAECYLRPGKEAGRYGQQIEDIISEVPPLEM